MRVLMVAARYFPFIGGVESHVHNVGTRMAALGCEVTLLTTDPSGALPAEENVLGMRVKRVRAWPKNRDYYLSPGIYTNILRGSWDIIHLQGYHTFVAPLTMLAGIQRRIPFVLSFHSGGHSSSLRNSIRVVQHAVLSPLIARADRLIAVAEFEAEFFSEKMGLDRGRFVVVPSGASVPPASRSPSKNDNRLVVSVGRLERYKGHHRVIAAFHELLRFIPDARLAIIGSGPYERELHRLVSKLGIKERVTITSFGLDERQGLSDLLGNASLVALLSDYEAHPATVMEALCLRRRVLVSDTSGMRELANKGLCRAIPLNADPSAAAAVMAEEIESKRQVPEFSVPDWDTCTRRLIGIYEEVLSRAEETSYRRRGEKLTQDSSEFML
jgi:glycosyltransferase involved in cell wall biosynthesis